MAKWRHIADQLIFDLHVESVLLKVPDFLSGNPPETEKARIAREVMALHRAGKKHKEITAELGLKRYQVEVVIQGSGVTTSTKQGTAINYFAHKIVQRNCLQCGKPFDGGKFVRMCDACKAEDGNDRW